MSTPTPAPEPSTSTHAAPVARGVFALILRRMRAPLIVLIAIYTVSIAGLVAIDGVDANGQPTAPMSFFHAFYFISYTATTIGFGEIPVAFSEAQRLWTVFCIYLTVVGWSYSILSILALVADRGFQQAVRTARFVRSVRNIRDPFYIICGWGETGSLIGRALDRLDIEFVVVDADDLAIQSIGLEEMRTDVPALSDDARRPAVLLRAGLRHPQCAGVLALTHDDDTNLAIAMAVRLLRPSVPVLARADHAATVANMHSFGVDLIINPYQTFADYLALAVHSSHTFQLIEWLTGPLGDPLIEAPVPPRGHWVVCGFGRFCQAVVSEFEQEGIEVTVIDPQPGSVSGHPHIVSTGTEAAPLRAAGIEDAVGIVCGTDKDVNNLSIAFTARQINPQLFIVMRQNLASNAQLFDAFGAQMNMVTSHTIAHRCLAVLTTPLLSQFLDMARRQNDDWAATILNALRPVCSGRVPRVWAVDVSEDAALAVRSRLRAGEGVTIDMLLRDPSQRAEHLPIVLLARTTLGAGLQCLPDTGQSLQPGDRLLFAGPSSAWYAQQAVLANANVLDYVISGRERPDGWLWNRIEARRQARGSA